MAMHSLFFFFFNDTATTEIYTLSLHDALPICTESSDPRRNRARCPPPRSVRRPGTRPTRRWTTGRTSSREPGSAPRSEEHTSELQSPCNLVCRLLLEKKKTHYTAPAHVRIPVS